MIKHYLIFGVKILKVGKGNWMKIDFKPTFKNLKKYLDEKGIDENSSINIFGSDEMQTAKLLSPAFVLRLADFFTQRHTVGFNHFSAMH